VKRYLHEKFTRLLQTAFHLTVPVLVVTPSKMQKALDAFPFFDKSDDESKLHIIFLKELIKRDWGEKLRHIKRKENCEKHGDVLYIYTA